MATPKNIGRYEIISAIGHGAMGVVYLAHDPRIDRRVAIKTIHALQQLPDSEAEEIRMRFVREARAAGRLQHPGIVTIFDVGEHEGSCFIAMEYIEGNTLEPYTRKESLLPPADALGLIVQACDALDYAHQNHLVHRDIKPANLMLLRNGRLKITDFGLAKNPHTNLTQEGILIGTPNYMSPEQVMGKPLDGRSDLFSLAAVLYELLTGERPFPGDTVTTIIYRILHQEPAAPQLVNRRIPPAIGQVLMKALAKEPERRYQTGGSLAHALQGQTMVMAAGVGSTRAMPARQPALASDHAAAPDPSSPDAGSAAAARAHAPGVEARAAPGQVPAAALASRGRGRSGFILAGALAIILLCPEAGTRDDRWGRGDAGGEPPFHRTAGILAGGGPPAVGPGPSQAAFTPPPVTLPGEAESVTVTVRTSPPGARVYLDDVEALGGVIRLPRGDAAPHTIVAENDCFIEKVTYRLGGKVKPEPLTIQLRTSKVARVSVTSKPLGARILLDGSDTGQITPGELAVSLCNAHKVALKLEGYTQVERALGDPPAPVSVVMPRIPVGFVRINAPYPVSVFENGKLIGTGGSAIKLSGGGHTLVLSNEDLFVEKTLSVTVQADRTIAPEARLPGVGSLTVLASPSNCNIFVNGREVGAPPIHDYKLGAGTYTIRAVYVPTGEAKETTVTIAAGGGTRVPFKFSP